MSSAAPTAVVDLKAATRHLMVDFLQMKEFTAEPLILTEGEGVWVTDVDGNRYLDSISGVYTVSVGHRNQAAIDAVTAQLHRIAFASPVMTTNPAAIELATLLTRVSPPGMTTVKFFSGGSEACEAAIKLARQYHSQTGNPHKVKILGRYGDYHGATLGALGSSGSAGASRSFGPFAPGFVHVHQPMAMRCPYCRHRGACDLTCAEIIEATIEAEGADTVAAFIATPVSFAVWPPADYWPTVRRICDRHNVLLIYDEIITGFGRLGTLWGADYVGAAPDIIACGKGMGGGYSGP
jgi:adenosylmethionine-8-amino-7-oxononanoate aminotransferase